jgi:hypothetical protein
MINLISVSKKVKAIEKTTAFTPKFKFNILHFGDT